MPEETKGQRTVRLMNEQNARIAALQREKDAEVEPDEVRLQREQERRDKWGTLRAREHPSRRPNRHQGNVFPHVDLSP